MPTARKPKPPKHDPHVEVSMSGCRVVCSCGWVTHHNLEQSFTNKKKALARWYEEHFLPETRKAGTKPTPAPGAVG